MFADRDLTQPWTDYCDEIEWVKAVAEETFDTARKLASDCLENDYQDRDFTKTATAIYQGMMQLLAARINSHSVIQVQGDTTYAPIDVALHGKITTVVGP